MTTAEMLRREGEARGEARGKAEGKAEGKREMLLLLLRQRFGRIPAAAVARIATATIEQLDAWFGQGLTASSLDEVLGAQVAGPPKKATQPARAQPRAARPRTRG